jgi:hypothetical protein
MIANTRFGAQFRGAPLFSLLKVMSAGNFSAQITLLQCTLPAQQRASMNKALIILPAATRRIPPSSLGLLRWSFEIGGNDFQARIVTRHCRPSCSVGMGAYSRDVTAPVHSLRSSEASIPMTVIGTPD